MEILSLAIVTVLIFLTTVMLSTLLHETGHRCAYAFYGIKVEKCVIGKVQSRELFSVFVLGAKYVFTSTMFFGGGFTSSSEVSKLKKREICKIAWMGPLVNLFLCIGFSCPFWTEYEKILLQLNSYYIFCAIATIVNFTLFVGNIVPSKSKPTDGALIFNVDEACEQLLSASSIQN